MAHCLWHHHHPPEEYPKTGNKATSCPFLLSMAYSSWLPLCCSFSDSVSVSLYLYLCICVSIVATYDYQQLLLLSLEAVRGGSSSTDFSVQPSSEQRPEVGRRQSHPLLSSFFSFLLLLHSFSCLFSRLFALPLVEQHG